MQINADGMHPVHLWEHGKGGDPKLSCLGLSPFLPLVTLAFVRSSEVLYLLLLTWLCRHLCRHYHVCWFRFNSCQNVHFVDTDICTLTLLFLSSSCSQSDTDQLYNTQYILRALASGSKQALSQVISVASLVERSAVILSSCTHTW